MSIRPTDLQIIIQKTQEVERLQQNQQQQSKVQQQQFAEQLHKQSETKERQVNSSPHADEVTIKGKDGRSQKESQTNNRKKRHDGSQGDGQHKGTNTPGDEHIIDIKI